MSAEKLIGRYYFDYAAATPVDPRVIKVMEPYAQKIFANPSSLYEEGRSAKVVLEEARDKIADELGAKSAEIFFTSGGSEADNWALRGIVEGGTNSKGKHIIVSTIEHKAIIHVAEYLRSKGIEVDFCPVDSKGIIDFDFLRKMIRKETVLVSVMMANNEIGVVQDIEKVVAIVKEKNKDIYVHSDACQAVNYLKIDVEKIGLDLLTVNAGKIYGPRGIGVLYIRKGVKIGPLIFGGGQEGGKRAGTENIAGAVGMAEAMQITSRIRESEIKRLKYLQKKMILGIKETIPEAILNGDEGNRLPNNINFSFPGAEGESLVLYLDNAGLAVSTGSACSAADLEPSHVLLALGIEKELAHCSLRITLGRWTGEEAVDRFLAVLPGVVKKVREMSATYIR